MISAADHPADRRLRRRWLGQDHRNQGGGQSARWYRRYPLVCLYDREHGRVPVVGLGLGSVAGLGAARLAASHYSVMTKNSAMFVAGPPVVKRLGQDLTKQELGGADIQTRAGGVDEAVDTEEQASHAPGGSFPICRRRLRAAADDRQRRRSGTIGAIADDGGAAHRRQVYKMRPIIDAVVDQGSFFEVNANFGRPIITGLARLEGRAVLLLASDPFHYGGSWTADACQKVVRWVDFAETFHLPVVYLMDCPGFMIGLEAEKAATIRHGVRAMAAVNQTTVPWCTVILRNSFGVAGVVHQPADRFSLRYAWPSAHWGSLPLEGGIEAAYRAELDASGRSASQAEGDRGSPQPAALAVPVGRKILGRGDHRPAPDPFAVVRIRPPRRAAAHAGAGDPYGDPAMTWRDRALLHATTGIGGREIASAIDARTMPANRPRRTPAGSSTQACATGRRRRRRCRRPVDGRKRSSRTPDWRVPARTAAR